MKPCGDNISEFYSMMKLGARYQIKLSIALMSIVPLLSVLYIVSTYYTMESGYSQLIVQSGVVVFAVVLSICGYVMLRKYPANIERLRYLLKNMAEGELPQSITLIKSEDDIKAIENYLNMLLDGMRRRIDELESQLALARRMKDVIRTQSEEILAAEQHRVMMQSLGAACHHMGQPLTVLRAYLDLAQKEGGAPDAVKKCQDSMDMLSDVMDKLRNVSEYRTVPYKTSHLESSVLDNDIIDIEQ